MKKRVFNVLIGIIQVLALAAALTLEYLSDKKMGVARYLIYKKEVLGSTWFSQPLLNAYLSLLVAGMILGLLLLAYCLIKKKDISLTRLAVKVIFFNIVGLVLLQVQFIKDLKAFHFILIAAGIMLLTEYVKLINHTVFQKTNPPNNT